MAYAICKNESIELPQDVAAQRQKAWEKELATIKHEEDEHVRLRPTVSEKDKRREIVMRIAKKLNVEQEIAELEALEKARVGRCGGAPNKRS